MPVSADKPLRVQLSRLKGWRKPENTVVVARPTRWGNPFDWREARDELGGTEVEAKEAVKSMFLELAMLAVSDNPNRSTGIIGHDEQKLFIRQNLPSLRGRNLACWCKPGEPCHADVLLEIANG